MANLQNKSIRELLELDYGISTFLQVVTVSNDYDPAYLGKEAFKGFYQVLELQQEANVEVRKRILELITPVQYDSAKDAG